VRFIFFVSLLLFSQAVIFAQDLLIGSSDVWISQGSDGGYHLYIRKKTDINSVLLVETTRDPTLHEPNYAYRTNKWNSINGDELRIIDGIPLSQNNGWSLIATKTEYLPQLGTEVFHIYIPYIIYYGYPNTRNGEIYVGNGTYFNIRAFSLPYGDYRSAFKDNPFILEVTQEPLAGPPEINYMKETEDAFDRIARNTNGIVFRSRGPEDIVETIEKILGSEVGFGKDLDLVLCLDTTASMRNDIAAVRSRLIKYTQETAQHFKTLRVGMVLFRDYKDIYLTKVIPFTADMKIFQKTLNAVQAAGGGDIPEAVYEGLYDSITKFEWRDTNRLIILIGDAPPHPIPRGNITEDMVTNTARTNHIRINTIMLPQ
jgi:hypothetical protein